MLRLPWLCIGVLRFWSAIVCGLIVAIVCTGFSLAPEAAQPHKGGPAVHREPGVQVPVKNSGAKKPGAKKPGAKNPGAKRPGANTTAPSRQ